MNVFIFCVLLEFEGRGRAGGRREREEREGVRGREGEGEGGREEGGRERTSGDSRLVFVAQALLLLRGRWKTSKVGGCGATNCGAAKFIMEASAPGLCP